MNQNAYEYDVAVSCAGADRELAAVIVSIAQANELRVFFDEQHLWESWGKNLNEYLGEIYDSQSQYCLILISKDYCERAYTNLERRRALDRALESKKVEYILPVRLDDSWLEGLPRATAYLDLRSVSLIEVGEMMVRKIKGADVRVILPEGIEDSKVVSLNAGEGDSRVMRRGKSANQPIDFVAIQVAEECKAWKLQELKDSSGLSFRGGFGWYEDPIFDITVMSRHDKPILLTAVGIEAARLSQGGYKILGGGGGEPLDLHRTYKLPLPDLLESLARKQREMGISWGEAVEVDEIAYCRLPSPILIESYRPYRYGLHLFDYVNFCPTEVELFFWARTDIGDVRSERALLTFVIGSEIPPLARYRRLLSGEDEVKKQQERKLHYLYPGEKERKMQRLAYELWERAGHPRGRDQEFWDLAEKELPARLLDEEVLHTVHKRPL